MPAPEKYTVRFLPHGEATIYSEREGETFHCGLGPVAESKILYVDQLELDKKWISSTESKPLVVWDVGLGAAATKLENLHDPLDLRWLERVQRSDRSNHFTSENFEGHPISEKWFSELSRHPQFAVAS